MVALWEKLGDYRPVSSYKLSVKAELGFGKAGNKSGEIGQIFSTYLEIMYLA